VEVLDREREEQVEQEEKDEHPGRDGQGEEEGPAARKPWKHGSEALVDTSLLQDSIRSVPGLDLTIDDKAALAERAEPDLMISFPRTLEAASMGEENLLELGCEGRAHSGG
jgi:hypothetical protein